MPKHKWKIIAVVVNIQFHADVYQPLDGYYENNYTISLVNIMK